jgi:mannose-6-phosphate isomerase
MSLYPLTFQPIFKERVWGGRHLEKLYRKPLPSGRPIGESWEISDRPDDVSLIANGPLAGKDLHWLLEHHSAELLGKDLATKAFPLLIKILDARETLSLQVHPPAHRAVELKGEPKTELWYVAHADPGAELFVGLKRGVTRQQFERKIESGTVAECFHNIAVKAGDAMFLPSGRVHALGGGLVIFEIQQNSDTTYRVFDWNRVGLDGKPRELHIKQSLASIDFNDFEPGLIDSRFVEDGPARTRPLVRDSLFTVDMIELPAGKGTLRLPPGRPTIIGLIEGSLSLAAPHDSVSLAPGGFGLVPASIAVSIDSQPFSRFLRIQPN